MDKSNDNQDKYTYIQPDPSANINDLIAFFVGKKTGTFKKTVITLEGNDGGWDEVSLSNLPTGFKVTPESSDLKFNDDDTSGNSTTRSWTYNIKGSLKTVTDKMKTNTALTSADYVYLQNLPFNGYRIINYFGSVTSTGGAITLDEYAEYIAIENARSQMGLLLDLAGRSLSEYMNELEKTSSTNKETKADYQKVIDNITKQKALFTEDQNIKRIPIYMEKIRKLQAEVMPKNRIDKLQ